MSVVVGTTVQLDGSKSTDPEQLPLDYAWAFLEVPAGSQAVLEAAATAKPYFIADRPGKYVARLIVSDGTTTSLPDTVSVEAGQCGANLPAVDALAATPDKANSGDVVSLSATVTHADEADDCMLKRAESYPWGLTKVPAGGAAALLAKETATPSFTPDRDGDYEVSLTVTDDLGHESVPKSLVVTVGNCGTASPSVTAIGSVPATPGVGTLVQLSGTIEDPDTLAPCSGTESYNYAWKFLSVPAGSKASLNLASVDSPSFTADVAGKCVVGLVVTDTKGHESPLTTAEVTVTNCGSGSRPWPRSRQPRRPLRSARPWRSPRRSRTRTPRWSAG